MIVFLKNTVTQINTETRQGNAPVVRVQKAAAPSVPEERNYSPEGVDAVTGGTQGISHYFAVQTHLQPLKPDTEDT